MPNKLSSITKELLLEAFVKIDQNGIPKDNEYNEYWLNYGGKKYPFKYSVELASSSLSKQDQKLTTDFQSNNGYRKTIADLGFPIYFQSWNERGNEPSFFIGASYFGKEPNLIPMFDDFIKNEYWRTDHDLSSGQGAKIYKLLQKAKINDRIAIRFLSRKNRSVEIMAIGTIASVNNIGTGELKVKWDYKPRLFKGPVPSGEGAGNWSLTLLELKRPEDIEVIFDYSKNFKRAARLSWNDNGYIFPSGRLGKSADKDSHEAQFGYGHEEWILDMSKQIDGYHYAFLEPIRKHQSAYIYKKYDVWLYTLDGQSKQRYWVGNINDIEVIDSQLANNIKQQYLKAGWLEEMENQIKISGANDNGFSGYDGLDIFNIRFKPENILINDPYVEIPEDNLINGVNRYTFLHMRDSFKLPEQDPTKPFIFVPPTVIPTNTPKSPKKKSTVRRPKAVEIIYIHRAISDNLTLKLREKYGSINVNPEHPAGYGQNRIDIVVNDADGLIFYEIKSYNSLLTCIREAIGQLLEYSMWPEHQKAKKMVVVSQLSITKEAKRYFKHLRDISGLPIFYQSYNYKSDTLSDEF